MNETGVNKADSDSKSDQQAYSPAYALIEVMMHELANPVQAARTTLHLLQHEPLSAVETLSRVQSLDTALERVAIVIRNVQAIKDSALTPPSSVSSDRLLADITTECAAVNLQAVADVWPVQSVILRLHGAAIPVLVSNWAANARDDHRELHMSLRPVSDGWALNAKLRHGQGEVVSRESTAVAVAGYPAAIGEFMRCAGGSAFVMEDDTGTFELELNIVTWN